MTSIVLTSGGFDPLHVGHVRLINAAAELGSRLVVVLNSDLWLHRKKGAAFMPEDERLEIVRSLRAVDFAFVLEGDAPDVGQAIIRIRPSVFAKGGDRRTLDDLPAEEIDACARVGAKIVFGVGGGKVQSSSVLCHQWDVTRHRPA